MIEGIVRESIGKKASKALKRDGYLIANIYGKGIDNVFTAFKANEFIKMMRAKENLFFDVKVGDKTYKVVVAEYQKHPVSGDLTHVDLRIVLDDVYTKYLVPVKTVGIPKGLKNKGVLITSKRRVPLKCKGSDLPNNITLDVSDLDVGDSILARDLPLNDNVKVVLNPSVAVVGVIKAK